MGARYDPPPSTKNDDVKDMCLAPFYSSLWNVTLRGGHMSLFAIPVLAALLGTENKKANL